MNSSTRLRSKPSALLRSRSAATWLSMVLASACCSEETRAYRATCPSIMTHSLRRLGGAGHEEEPGTLASPSGVFGAPEPTRYRRPGGGRVGGGVAQTGRGPLAAGDAEGMAWPYDTP